MAEVTALDASVDTAGKSDGEIKSECLKGPLTGESSVIGEAEALLFHGEGPVAISSVKETCKGVRGVGALGSEVGWVMAPGGSALPVRGWWWGIVVVSVNNGVGDGAEATKVVDGERKKENVVSVDAGNYGDIGG